MTLDAQNAVQGGLPIAPAMRKRGRPHGSKAKVTQSQLRTHHFSFVRALIQGIAPRKAWNLYLAHEGGPDDERHFSACLRHLQQQIQTAANDRGLAAIANTALSQLSASFVTSAASAPVTSVPSAPVVVAAVPSLEDWIVERCSGGGIDEDFYSHAEWVELYEDEFGLDQPLGKITATAIPEMGSASTQTAYQSGTALVPLESRLAALNHLAMDLAVPPTISDSLSTWLSSSLCRRLCRAEVDGETRLLLTLDNLITFINQFHFRWWTKVPGLGKARGDRLLAWLQPIAESLGRPLLDIATRPLHQHLLAQQRALNRLDSTSKKRYGIVPLDRLAVPPELDGRLGTFRARTANSLEANNDLEAILAWLRRHQDSLRTFATYSRIVERFYLWCVCVKKTPLSSLVEGDFYEYHAFMDAPPTDWVQPRRTGRQTNEWRPFKGPVSAANLKLNFTVISGLLTSLQKGGYLSAHAATRVPSSMKMPVRAINIARTFDDAQWHWILKYWRSLYVADGPQAKQQGTHLVFPSDATPDQSFARASSLRRIRLILELGSTTGLKLNELATTRRAALIRHTSNGQACWILQVGKNQKLREVLIHDDVKALLDQHHSDIVRARAHCGPTSHLNSELKGLGSDGQTPMVRSESTSDIFRRPVNSEINNQSEILELNELPLIGALRPPPPRWTTDNDGMSILKPESLNTNRDGGLDPTALYQSLKRFLKHCCDAWEITDESGDVDKLRNASTHWLRHFFANTAVEDSINPSVLMELMGHASLKTTTVYLQADRNQEQVLK